jgi:intein-encoded DNA endonuclease-like protein
MSESFIYSPGLQNVASYKVSGIPFVTGGINATGASAVKISFPYVTRWISFSNMDTTNEAKIAFSANGLTTSNYFRIAKYSGVAGPLDTETAESVRFELKVTELWITGSNSFDIIAGLTNIPVERINNSANSPSGSNWSGSANV